MTSASMTPGAPRLSAMPCGRCGCSISSPAMMPKTPGSWTSSAPATSGSTAVRRTTPRRPKEATWRRFMNVTLANGDDVGVVAPWQFPGQDAPPSPQKLEAERKAEHVFLEILRRLSLAGVFVGETGPRNAPFTFAKEREARMAKVGKAALDAAMRRLFDQGKIRIEEYQRSDRHMGRRIVET